MLNAEALREIQRVNINENMLEMTEREEKELEERIRESYIRPEYATQTATYMEINYSDEHIPENPEAVINALNDRLNPYGYKVTSLLEDSDHVTVKISWEE